VHSVGLYEFSDELKRYVKAYPSVNVRLEYKKSNQIYEDVLSGTLDVGVIAYPTKRPQIRLIPFREDRLVLICSPAHPFAKHKSVSIKKLDGQNFVGFEKDIPTHKAIERALQKHSIRVQYVAEVDNIEVIKRIVEVGTGIAIVPSPPCGPRCATSRWSRSRSRTRRSSARSHHPQGRTSLLAGGREVHRDADPAEHA